MYHMNNTIYYHCLLDYYGHRPVSPKISGYLAIQHTDTVYANQGVCAYHFSLDSGGTDEFGQLYISLQFNDKGAKRWPSQLWRLSHSAGATLPAIVVAL